MSSRDHILERLRQRRRTTQPAPEGNAGPVLASPCCTLDQKLARFQAAMEAVHGEVLDCRDRDWVTMLADWLQARRIRTLLVGNGREPLASLSSSSAGLPELIRYDEPAENWQNYLFDQVDAGLTTTRGGIAETGSLILWPDTAEPRLISLAPPVHIALLKASDLYGTFADAIRAQNWSSAMPANALLISGPSRTADIEQTLAYGVHGPRELLVLVTS